MAVKTILAYFSSFQEAAASMCLGKVRGGVRAGVLGSARASEHACERAAGHAPDQANVVQTCMWACVGLTAMSVHASILHSHAHTPRIILATNVYVGCFLNPTCARGTPEHNQIRNQNLCC